jgi:hypothetical protein
MGLKWELNSMQLMSNPRLKVKQSNTAEFDSCSCETIEDADIELAEGDARNIDEHRYCNKADTDSGCAHAGIVGKHAVSAREQAIVKDESRCKTETISTSDAKERR